MKITENLLKKIAYNLYKIDWFRQHISTERMLSAYKEYADDTFWYDEYNNLSESEIEDVLTLENFFLSGVSSVGIDGECYVCFEEFLRTEYKDIHYMSYLLKDSEFWDTYKELYGVSDEKADEPTLDYGISEVIVRLFQAFPDCCLNHKNEFIADKNTNQYFILKDCHSDLDVCCKALERLSYSATKAQPYHNEWRNKNLHIRMLGSINKFLGTKFTIDDMRLIYSELGNCTHHQKTIEFVNSGYDLKVLTKGDENNEI